MRKIVSASLTLLMAFSLLLATSSSASANALAGGGYSSSYAGESVFTNKAAGESGQFSAIFFNDGSQTWAPSVVGLLVCLADKTTCNVASPNAAYASGWFSTTVYATVSASVAPGQNGFFVYNFTVPAGTAPGTVATFNGDVGLIATGGELRPQGYFQINTAPGTTTGGMTISPTSASLPVGGQQQFTVTGAPTGATVTWTVNGGCGAVTNTGLFAATSTNSPTQPCSVVATAGGSTATAPITVFGPASSIKCSASKTTIPADGGSTTTSISGTLIDTNGNTVSNDSSTEITFTNNTPSLLTASGSTPDEDSVAAGQQRIAQSGVASATFASQTTTGTGVISLSSGSLTGCSQQVTLAAVGAAAKLAATFGRATIAADGTSQAILEVDINDANGAFVATDNTTKITVSRDSGSAVCTSAGGGSVGPGTVSGGSAYFLITSTTTPGTCGWTATSDTGLTSASATLTTVLVGAANKLAVTATGSPKPADGVATLRVTVALRDAAGSPVTTNSTTCTQATTGGSPSCADTQASPQVTLTATLGSNCSGTNAAGASDSVKFGTAASSGTTTPNSKNSGTLHWTSILAGSSELARYTLVSTFATTCTLTISAGNFVGTSTASNVSSTSVDVVFTAGGPANVACAFSPRRIISDGSSTSIGTVSIVDGQNNLATAGSFSVSFSRTSGDNVTTLLTSSPQNTSNGIAQFTVKSSSAGLNGTDTYTASATIAGVNKTGTCLITTQTSLP